jgi:hypothetical protein
MRAAANLWKGKDGTGKLAPGAKFDTPLKVA